MGLPRNSFVVVALLCSVATACSHDAGTKTPSTPPGASVARITFDAPWTHTELSDGAIAFAFSPALAADEVAVCSIDGELPATCALGSVTGGEYRFSGLAPGRHDVVVETVGSASRRTRATHVLEVVRLDVLVFGATPGGIIAAVAAAREGRSVAVVEPTQWIGGMMSGGLAFSDVGWRGREIIGGLTDEFFDKVRAQEAARGRCPSQCEDKYEFEPHVAEQVFDEMLSGENITIERGTRLLEVQKNGAEITAIATDRGTIQARVFIDASYEGDLIAAAGIRFAIGREARAVAVPPNDPTQLAVQEDHAGALPYSRPSSLFVDPYRVPGDPTSGTIAFVEPRPSSPPSPGDGDSRVMAYTYRLCVTDDPGNRIPFEPPPNYDPERYEGSARVAEAWRRKGVDLAVQMFNPARTVLSTDPNYYKYDLNGGSTFSIDMTAPELNQRYAEADPAERERIREAYRDYAKGLLYFWQTDARFAGLNAKIARFGYCADEFADRGGWPHQLYVRVSRRMIGEYVMNENDVLQNGRRPAIEDVVGFGAYNLDIHTVRYFAAPFTWPDNTVRDALVNEGGLIFRQPNDEPYPVSYRALVPKEAEATNLLDPVTLSATAVAYSALRMEPTFMILGQAAGTAASLAAVSERSVQSVSYQDLRDRLLANGQRLRPH